MTRKKTLREIRETRRKRQERYRESLKKRGRKSFTIKLPVEMIDEIKKRASETGNPTWKIAEKAFDQYLYGTAIDTGKRKDKAVTNDVEKSVSTEKTVDEPEPIQTGYTEPLQEVSTESLQTDPFYHELVSLKGKVYDDIRDDLTRIIASIHDQGKTWQAIADALNQAGVLTRTKKEWTHKSVSSLMHRFKKETDKKGR